MKLSPYCTAQMMDDLFRAKVCPLGPVQHCPTPAHVARWWLLKSRGWMNYQGVITDQGIARLIKFGYISDSTN